jgi:hypothetical protein
MKRGFLLPETHEIPGESATAFSAAKKLLSEFDKTGF